MRILVVEDDVQLAEMLVEALTDLVVLDNTDKLLSAKRLDQIKR